MNPIRFGIIGTGGIAHKFARTAPLVPEMTLLAAASRREDTAQRFAGEFGIPRAYGSYDAMLADPDIDAVYVATPHPMHKPCTLAAIAAGKHVLCEKPMALTAADAAEVFVAAREKGVFLMEAMWTRFIPTIELARRWIAEGRIGTLRYMTAAFGYNTPLTEPLHPIFSAEMAGGALYDVGVYAIEAALDFFAPRKPDGIQGMADFAPTGVDGVNAMLLHFEGGGIASLSSAVLCPTENIAVLYGSEGKIRLYPAFYAPETAELWVDDRCVESYRMTIESGFEYELRHMIGCIREGKLTSDRIPPEDTLECAEIFEALKRRFGERTR